MCKTSAVGYFRKNVDSRISAVFLHIAIIRISRISAVISFQTAGI